MRERQIAEFHATGNETALEGQPEDGKAIYIVSRANEFTNTTAGAVFMVGTRLAAQRVVDGSHEVASEKQIRLYLAERSSQAALIAKEERTHRGAGGTILIQQVAPNPRPASDKGARN